MKKIIERGKADIMETPAINRAATKYHDENAKQQRKAMMEKEKVRAQMYKAKDKGQWELHKQMKEDQPIPLVAVRRKERAKRTTCGNNCHFPPRGGWHNTQGVW